MAMRGSSLAHPATGSGKQPRVVVPKPIPPIVCLMQLQAPANNANVMINPTTTEAKIMLPDASASRLELEGGDDDVRSAVLSLVREPVLSW